MDGPITPTMGVSRAVHERPGAMAVFRSHRRPDFGLGPSSWACHVMSVRSAARTDRIHLSDVLDGLNNEPSEVALTATPTIQEKGASQ